MGTWHGTSFDQSCHQVNLACLRDGVGVDRPAIMEQFFSQSSITSGPCKYKNKKNKKKVWIRYTPPTHPSIKKKKIPENLKIN